MSELNIMDDNFQSVYQPFGEGNAFPGLLSVLVVIDQRSMPDTHKVIAFGGNVNSMRGRHSASVGFIVCVASCLGVGAGCLCVCVCVCVAVCGCGCGCANPCLTAGNPVVAGATGFQWIATVCARRTWRTASCLA